MNSLLPSPAGGLQRIAQSPILVRVLPFLLFVGLTLTQGRFGPHSVFWIYSAKTLVGAAMVWAMWPWVTEMRWAWSWEAVLGGIGVFVIWVALDPYYPHLDEVITVAPGQSLVPLARAIRGARYSHLLDLHGSVRTRVLRLLVPGPWTGYDARRGPRQRLIRHHDDRYPDRVPVAERYFEAAVGLDVTPDGRPAECFISPAAEARAESWLLRAGLDQEAPLAVLVPGAAHATKRWPVHHWRRLASDLARRGWRVALIGGGGDRIVAAEIATVAGRRAAESGALKRRACLRC